MKGANIAKYPIVKQAEHIFQFKVQNGDVVKLVRRKISLICSSSSTTMLPWR